MNNPDKMLGEARRNQILKWLEEASSPLTGSELAKRTKVSRQVIVQDVSLLKAKGQPILATAQGYILVADRAPSMVQRKIACYHLSDIETTQKELQIVVDYGAVVVDVSVDHPIYGDLTASLLIKNRYDISQFIKKISSTNAALLSELTGGTHMHTIEAASEQILDNVCDALEKEGFLLS